MAYRQTKKKKTAYSEQDLQVAKYLENCFWDPLRYVLYIFPWGKGKLEGHDGPDKWQTDVLIELGERLHDNAVEDIKTTYKSIGSGHGVGKSALISWIIKWWMATRPDPSIVVTANTGDQLRDTTWRELSVWNEIALDGHWYDCQKKAFTRKERPSTWYASPVVWSTEKPDAVQGRHANFVLTIFDESSAIDDIIWESVEGASANIQRLWLVCGNPTRAVGKFRHTLPGGDSEKKWHPTTVDGRTAKMTDKNWIQGVLDEYGEDSDFARVRVYGKPPKASSMQLIAEDVVKIAASRGYHRSEIDYAPKIMGVDIARYGDDLSVIQIRQGLMAFKPESRGKEDNVVVADWVAFNIDQHKPSIVCIDQGQGVGVIDILRHRNYRVLEVPFGSSAAEKDRFYNKRMEMWWRMAQWLKTGGSIYDLDVLKRALTEPEYGYTGKRDVMQLERKEDIKTRLSKAGKLSNGLDYADALALTFAYTVDEVGRMTEVDRFMQRYTMAEPAPYDMRNFRGNTKDWDPLHRRI